MAGDIANLGITVDASGVDRAKASLDDFARSSQAVATAVQELARAQDQTNRILQDNGRALDDINGKTSSYVTTLAKLATGAAAVGVAYEGMAKAVDLFHEGISEQLDVMDRLGDAFRSITTYGKDAFQFMSDGAINAQRNLSMLAMTIGTTGSQLASFQQSMSTFGASPQQSNGAIGTIQGILSGMDAGSLAGRNTLAQLGVTGTDPAEVARQVIQQLQQMQAGPERNAIAGRLLGSDAAGLANDTSARPLPQSDLQLYTNQMAASNAAAERNAAQRRAELAAEKDTRWAQTPGLSMFSDQQRAALGQDWTLGLEQMRDPNTGFWSGIGTGLSTWARGAGAYALGGGAPGGNAPGLIAHPGAMPEPGAMDAGTPPPINYAGGYAALGGIGINGPGGAAGATDTYQLLLENQQKLGITTDQLNQAFAKLTDNVFDAQGPVNALTKAANIASARASGATGGPRGANVAGYSAEADQMIATGAMSPGDRAEYINQRTRASDAQGLEASNSAQFAESQNTSATISQITALLAGQSGAASLLSGARRSARQMNPSMLYGDDSNTELDYSDEPTQSMLRGGADSAVTSAASMIKRYTQQISEMQRQTNAYQTGDTSGGVASLHADTGIDLIIKQLQDFTEALSEGGDESKKLADTMGSVIEKLNDQKAQLDAIRPTRAAARITAGTTERVGDITNQYDLIQSGASPMDVMQAQNVDTLTKQNRASGGNLSAADIQAQATALTETTTALQKATQTQKQYSDAINDAADTAAGAAAKLIMSVGTRGGPEAAGKSILGSFESTGLKTFMTDPLENLMKNALAMNSEGSSTFSFGSPGASSGTGILGKLFGLTGGSGAGNTSTIASATQTITEATITATMVNVSGASLGGGDMGGGGSYASLLGGSGATSGALASSGTSYADMFAAGEIAMHGGGIVGRDFSHIIRGIDPSVWLGAPRYHSGLMPDEQAAILQKGERVIPKNQVQNGATGGTSIHLHGPFMNVTTPDAHSFGATQNQLQQKALNQLGRMGQRNR